MIEVTSHLKNITEAQTYEIECGEGEVLPIGDKVRVRLVNTNRPLMIAEISAYGYPLGKFFELCFLVFQAIKPKLVYLINRSF